MIIYLDADYKCHVANDGNMIAVETDFFNGKCSTFIEGYRLIPAGAEYNGNIVAGDMYFPWVNYIELETAQITYEREEYKRLLAENAEYEAALSEIEAALAVI